MSQDFRKVCVLDDRLNVKSDVDFAVMKGAQSKVEATFKAVSESNSQMTFNLQVPSELTIIDREVTIESTYTIRMEGTPNNGEYLFDYGNGHALAPFPVHQSFTTMTTTINNNSVSVNIRDILPALMRMHDRRFLSRYNGSAPVAFDTYQKYSDAVDTNNNPNGSYNNTSDNDLMPRGAFNLVSVTGNTVGDGVTPKTVDITFKTYEPLLMSPFIFSDPSRENQGFYGIQNMNMILNVGSVGRVVRGVDNSVAGVNVSLVGISNSQLHMTFLTAPPSVLLPPKNVVPYYELPRYVKEAGELSNLAVNATTQVESQSIQLNQVPDKLIVFLRRKEAGSNFTTTDHSLPIKGISINFNNVSGLLSSARDIDLWKMSTKSGSNQTWQEFSGKANSYVGGVSTSIPTSGSYLMLDFAKDIPLSEPYYAPSSLGQFQLQYSVQVENNTGATLAAVSDYELVTITMNSGLFVCERGTSATYTAILTKQDVLDASSSQEKTTYSNMKRLVGGSLLSTGFDFLKAQAPKLLHHGAKLGAQALRSHSNPNAQLAGKVMGAFGYGSSGAGMAYGNNMSNHIQ